MLAGRDDQLTSIITALRLGPQAPGFCQAILGDRGVGKTVLLNEVERRVRADLDWPVLSHQATPGGDLTDSILEKLPKAADGVWRRAGRLLRELDKQVTIGAHLGVGGRVCGDGIVCPFHGWRFDGDGSVVEVPRLDRRPPRVNARVWDACECNVGSLCGTTRAAQLPST